MTICVSRVGGGLFKGGFFEGGAIRGFTVLQKPLISTSLQAESIYLEVFKTALIIYQEALVLALTRSLITYDKTIFLKLPVNQISLWSCW